MLSHRVESRGKLNILNLHLHSEDFYLHFFNLLYGFELENINAYKPNVPAIDLIDRTEKIIIQVSSTSTKAKIEGALKKKIMLDHDDYTFKFISIAKNASDLKKKTYSTPPKIKFDPQKDIHYPASILDEIKSLEIDELKVIYEFIKAELGEEERTGIKLFMTLDDLKTTFEMNAFLFDNQLAYFTEEEVADHEAIVNQLTTDRSALLIGHPATGKSVAVINIAEMLLKEGYDTYYYSFKKAQRWPEIWSELKGFASHKNVFVLDDIHLQPESASEALGRLRNDEKLKVLFISREVYKNIRFVDTINIYKELEKVAVRTEQPNIDGKVKGIVRLYQAYYKRKHDKPYPIGDLEKIVSRTHRNLIVLSEYLNLWEKHPESALAELEEADLYDNIYFNYFDRHHFDASVRNVLLQYLCIYYFEVEFYPNPSANVATAQLLEKALLVKEENDLYSLYHGEFALLLLKAYKLKHKRDFRRLGDDWNSFFFHHIKQYFLAFKADPVTLYPENLLGFLSAIPRFTKEVPGGVENSHVIFTKLVEDEALLPLLLESCKDEDDGFICAIFLISLVQHAPHCFKLCYPEFGDLALQNERAVAVYSYALRFLKDTELKKWLQAYCAPHLKQIISSSKLSALSRSAYTLHLFNKDMASDLYSAMDNDVLVQKAEHSRIHIIGNALDELKHIDLEKTQAIYRRIKNKTLEDKVPGAKINEVGNALNDLRRIDFNKTLTIFNNLDIRLFEDMIPIAKINEVGIALSDLKNINGRRTEQIYRKLANKELEDMAPKAKINEIGSALNELKNIDLEKTQTIYENIDESVFEKKVKEAEIYIIGNAFNELKNVDLERTQSIYRAVKNKVFEDKTAKANFNMIGKSLNELKNIDFDKTLAIYENIEDKVLEPKIPGGKIHEVATALNELKNISLKKTSGIYRNIKFEVFEDMIPKAKINEVGTALNDLRNIDFETTLSLYNQLDDEVLKAKIEEAKIHLIASALNELKNIDLERTRALCDASHAFILERVVKADVPYRQLVDIVSFLSRVSPKLGLDCYTNLPTGKLLQQSHYGNIYIFNLLAEFLLNINLDRNNEKFKKLIEAGYKKSQSFLASNDLMVIGKYLKVMLKLDHNLTPQLEENLMRYKLIIMLEESKRAIPGFIGRVFMHSPKLAEEDLLKQYQKAYPGNESIVASSFFEIAKNALESEDRPLAVDYTDKALILAKTLDTPELQQRIEEFKKEHAITL